MAADNLTDTRPEIEPEFFSYRELPEDLNDAIPIWREMADLMKASGATFFRMTVASDQYPKPPYPHGLYLEGWRVDPAMQNPSGQQAPFNFPLTAASTPST